MAEDSDLVNLLERWFTAGDELAYRRAYEHLAHSFFRWPEAVEVLGHGALDEIRQDVLARLLDRQTGELRGAAAPLPYARRAWSNRLASALRKWKPRTRRVKEVRRHLTMHAEDAAKPVDAVVQERLDADRAIEIAGSLDGKGRLAVLLTTRPDRITDEDWAALLAAIPPPPPARPASPLAREEAALLLYPPKGPETAAEEERRLNSFDHLWKRTVRKIRDQLLGEV